jgi:hypothetical protein
MLRILRAAFRCRLALRYRAEKVMRYILTTLIIGITSISNAQSLKSKIHSISCKNYENNQNYIETCDVIVDINPMRVGNNLMCYGELELLGSRYIENSMFRLGFLDSTEISATGNPNPLRFPIKVDFPEKWKVTKAKESWVMCEFTEYSLPYNKSLKDAP